MHYLQSSSFEPSKSAQTILGVDDQKKAERLAVQLKQVLDGMGLYVQMNKIPIDNSCGIKLSKTKFVKYF